MFDLKTAINAAVANTEQDTPESSQIPHPSPLQSRVRQGIARLALELPEQQAEAYALMGEYEEAVRLAPNAENTAILAAINRPDGEWCNCPPTHGAGRAKTPTRFVKDRFLRRGREMELYACAICGFMNCI